MTRRVFLRLSGVGLVATACAPARLAAPARAAAPDLPPEVRASAVGDPLLVVIFLRGGADGLHLVPPVGDRGYHRLRGGLALSETRPFTREFALHPRLEPLGPLVERGELAVIHAAGSPHPTRSHFEAQDLMEVGEIAARRSDGWLARALSDRAGVDPFETLAVTDQLPLSLRGSGAFAIGDRESFGLPGVSREARSGLADLYDESPLDPVAAAGARALSALSRYERALGAPRRRGRPGRRRRGGDGVARSAAQLIGLERAGIGVEAAFLESSGWDTHIRQGTDGGPMAQRIGDLGDGLAKLHETFGRRRRLLTVVMTEFGRTVRPNGGAGTDHGHGSAMLVAGPAVRGGVYGDWAGLSDETMYEGRDLPVLTDYRSVLAEVLRAHRGAPPPPDTFPDFAPVSLGFVS